MTDHQARRPAWGFRVAVTLVVLAVLAVAGLAAWQFWWAGRQAVANGEQVSSKYLTACPVDQAPTASAPVLPAPWSTDSPATGDVIGLLTLPGATTSWPIKAGVDDLTDAVGWYQQTSAPGQLGNMAVVGSRLMSGGPFGNILDLNLGDEVMVVTCDMQYTYTVKAAPRDLTVQPDATWVLDSVPGHSGVLPTDAWLTLIANQDVLPSPDRAVGFAQLTSMAPR